MRHGRLAGIAAVTVTSFLWGTTGTAATFAPEAGPLAIGAAALGLGGILQALVAAPTVWAALPQLRAHPGVIGVGAVAVGIYPLAFYSSMHYASVAIGSVISLASAPLASGVLEWVVDRSPLGRWWAVAATLGVMGCVFLCVSDFRAEGAGAASTVLGIGLGTVAGATYATYSWAVQRLLHRGIARGAAMGSVMGSGGLLLMPVLLVTGGPLLASWQAFAVASYMTLVPMFLGYLLFGYGLTKIPASTATTITLMEPAVASVLAVLIVGERLTALGWAGIALFGLVLVVLTLAPTPRRDSRRSRRRGEPARRRGPRRWGTPAPQGGDEAPVTRRANRSGAPSRDREPAAQPVSWRQS